jgi:acetyl-CoA carboxylase carboxyl transferase subunit alpha
MIAVIAGEGGSGGALAMACGNRVLMLEHAIYSVITPEGCASILLRDGTKAEGAAKAMKITAQDLIGLRIIDRIIPEPLGGAHTDPAATVRAVGDAIEEEMRALLQFSPSQLKAQRAQRFLAIGRG